MPSTCALLFTTLLVACGAEPTDGSSPPDTVLDDAGTSAGGEPDSGAPSDAGYVDAEAGGPDESGSGPTEGEADAAALSDASGPDIEPPRLVASTPAEGDDNVASSVVAELSFSEPVTFTPQAIRIRQARPARELALRASLAANGSILAIELDELPDLPADLTVELGAGIVDLAGNPLAPTSVRFTMPTWVRLGGAANRDRLMSASEVRLARDAAGRPLILTIEDGAVYASRWDSEAWQPLGAALNRQPVLESARAEPRIALATDAAGAPIAAFRERDGVEVVRWDGASWQRLGDDVDPDGSGSYAPALAVDGSGRPVVAFDARDASAQPVLHVRALSGARWQALAEIAGEVHGVRLAGDAQSDLVLAYERPGSGAFALRWNGTDFVPLGAGAALAASPGGLALSAGPDESCALTAPSVGTVRFDTDSWEAVAHDLGFVDSSAARDRALLVAPDAALVVAFSETPPDEGAARVYAQRLEGERFQPLGPALNRDRRANASRPALLLAERGAPLVAFLETPVDGGPTQVFVSLFNGDPTRPPVGLRERAHTAGCLETSPLEGTSLLDTGCFADAAGREPVAGFVPFDVAAPLWSDGASKRRFLMLPEGGSITYRDPGMWTFPEGTILIKEFSIEGRRGDPSTNRPVETRFLVVRTAGNWDRYSYEWNQDASDAVLRPEAPETPLVEFETEDEAGDPTRTTHFYPNRAQCLSCHQAPGAALGLQTAMLNRNFDYGVTVDNQLRSMQRLGLFGDSLDSSQISQARFMPRPSDTTYPRQARLRAHLHANCSSCHRPLEGLDLRIETPTLDSGLCSKITAGNLDGSVLYWRAVQRGYPGQPGVAPMPPLGTLAGSPQLEALLTDFILDPQIPCP